MVKMSSLSSDKERAFIQACALTQTHIKASLSAEKMLMRHDSTSGRTQP